MTKEEVIEKLDNLFSLLNKYPFSLPIAEAIDKHLNLLSEYEEEE
jgi:hypothetical protein